MSLPPPDWHVVQLAAVSALALVSAGMCLARYRPKLAYPLHCLLLGALLYLI